jgi:hypothetical protein
VGRQHEPLGDSVLCFGEFRATRSLVPCPECFSPLEFSENAAGYTAECCELHFATKFRPGRPRSGSAFKEGDIVFYDFDRYVVLSEGKIEGRFGAKTKVHFSPFNSDKHFVAPRERFQPAISQITAQEPAEMRIKRAHGNPPD